METVGTIWKRILGFLMSRIEEMKAEEQNGNIELLQEEELRKCKEYINLLQKQLEEARIIIRYLEEKKDF